MKYIFTNIIFQIAHICALRRGLLLLTICFTYPMLSFVLCTFMLLCCDYAAMIYSIFWYDDRFILNINLLINDGLFSTMECAIFKAFLKQVVAINQFTYHQMCSRIVTLVLLCNQTVMNNENGISGQSC